MSGGAIRAAAKAAVVQLGNSGVRGIKSEHHPVFSANRWAANSIYPAALADDLKVLVSPPQGDAKTLEIDEWVFAGGEEAAFSGDGDSIPICGTPSLHEAQEATSELAFALERVYLSPPHSVGSDGAFDTQSTIDKSCYNDAFGIASRVPCNAIGAFRLLSENRAVQNVVASIASDRNVWHAVLNNRELQDLMQTMQSQTTLFANTNKSHPSGDSSGDDATDSGETKPLTVLWGIVQKVKTTVVYTIINLSGYFENFFGGSMVDKLFPGSERKTSAEAAMETFIMGLAVMAIMVIVVKRKS